MKNVFLIWGALLTYCGATEIATLRAIEYPAARHAHWFSYATTKPNTLFQELQKDLQQKKALDVELISIATRSSSKSTMENREELIYPCEQEGWDLGAPMPFVPPKIPPTVPGYKNLVSIDAQVQTPTTFEPFFVGATFECEITKREKAYDCQCSFEYRSHCGWIKFSANILRKGIFYPDMPKFDICRLTPRVTIPPSTWQFVGFCDAWRKDSASGAKVALFLRVDPSAR